MSGTWFSDDVPKQEPISAAGWLRVGLRGGLLAFVTFGCLGLLLLLRVVERPLFGLRRPVTPFITQFVCKTAFVVMGIRYSRHGTPMRSEGALVANHGSWLDIFTLNASARIYYVSKAEIASWPGIGWLARATGTVFIARDRRQAAAQKSLFEERLRAGHRLLFFPEGTSTDSRRVVKFNPTLFAAFLQPGLRETLSIQPVTVVYTAPEGQDPRFYGWWGDMEFGPHLVHVLAAAKQGAVHVVFHTPVAAAGFADRKALAQYCENVVRDAHEARLATPPPNRP